MKLLLLVLFAAAAVASPSPVPDDEDAGLVDVVINGVPKGEPLDIGHILDVKLKEHIDGKVVSATNVLFPYTAEGLAIAAETAETPGAPQPVVLPEPVAPDVVPEPVGLPEAPEAVPEPVVLPEPVAPEVVPEPVVLPEPVAPQVVPEPVVLPEPVAPEVVPEPIVTPAPVTPEVIDSPDFEEIPVQAPQGPYNEEIYNDGLVSVTVNTPKGEDSGVVAQLQSWLNMVLNYFNSKGETTSHQIV